MLRKSNRPIRNRNGAIEKETQLQSVFWIKIAKIGYILLSVSLCILGVIKIKMPQFPEKKFCFLCGLVITAFGCIRLIGFCSKDLFRLAFQYDLEFGILLMILGILTCTHAGNANNTVWVLLGLLILADALFKIRIILEAKEFGIEQWKVLLIIAVAVSGLGSTLVFCFGKEPEILLGATLIAEGILSLAIALALVKIIRYQIKE